MWAALTIDRHSSFVVENIFANHSSELEELQSKTYLPSHLKYISANISRGAHHKNFKSNLCTSLIFFHQLIYDLIRHQSLLCNVLINSRDRAQMEDEMKTLEFINLHEQHIFAYLVLKEIAWLCNRQGSDVEQIAYLLIFCCTPPLLERDYYFWS